MAKEEKSIAELLGDMQHFCIVVENIEKAVEYFSKMGYKFGEIQTRARSPTNNPTIQRGKPISYTLKAAVSTNTKPALELTEVVEGRPTQIEFLEKKGSCIHHLCYSTPDLDGTIAKFKKLGIDAIQRPIDPSRLRWAMMDTTKMCGCYIEVSERR